MITILKDTLTMRSVDTKQFRAAVKALGRLSVAEHIENGLTRFEAQRAEEFFFEASEALRRLDMEGV